MQSMTLATARHKMRQAASVMDPTRQESVETPLLGGRGIMFHFVVSNVLPVAWHSWIDVE